VPEGGKINPAPRGLEPPQMSWLRTDGAGQKNQKTLNPEP